MSQTAVKDPYAGLWCQRHQTFVDVPQEGTLEERLDKATCPAMGTNVCFNTWIHAPEKREQEDL